MFKHVFDYPNGTNSFLVVELFAAIQRENSKQTNFSKYKLCEHKKGRKLFKLDAEPEKKVVRRFAGKALLNFH